MRSVKWLATLVLCTQLSGCWFVFIPVGSIVRAIEEQQRYNSMAIKPTMLAPPVVEAGVVEVKP